MEPLPNTGGKYLGERSFLLWYPVCGVPWAIIISDQVPGKAFETRTLILLLLTYRSSFTFIAVMELKSRKLKSGMSSFKPN